MISISFSGMCKSGKLTCVNSHRKYSSAPQISRKQIQSSTKTISMLLANNRII